MSSNVKTMRLIVGLAALLLAPGAARAGDCDNLKLCYKGSLGVKGGKPTKWFVNDTNPIRYTINVSLLPAAGQAKAVAAIKAAFDAFAAIPCTELKFLYTGPSSSFSDVTGQILISFGNYSKDPSSWISGNLAYNRYMNLNSYQTGEISFGAIAFNAGEYGWSVDGVEVQPPPSSAKNSVIDIKTAMMWLIPDMLGFLVASDDKGTVPIAYKTVLPALCASHTQGAQYTYFKKTTTSCVLPASPGACKGGFDPGEMGVISDGWFSDMPARDASVSPGKDSGGVNPESGVAADLPPPTKCSKDTDCVGGQFCDTASGYCKQIGTGGGDDGCSLAGGRAGSGALLLLLGLFLVCVLGRNRA